MVTVSRKGCQYLALISIALGYSSLLWWQQDDFFIHLQYAKNFSKTFIWAFNSGIPSYGTTSPLWVMVLSLFGLCHIDLIIAAKALSLVLGILTFLLLYKKAEIFFDSRILFLFVMSLAFNHWYRLAVGSGMEATLASLCITVLYLRTYQHQDSKRYSFTNGILIGLCILVRPEFSFLLILFLLAGVVRRERFRAVFVSQTMILLGIALAVLPWILFAAWQIHSIIPTTVLIKTGRYLEWANIFSAIARVGTFYLPTSIFEISMGMIFIVFVVRKNIKLTNGMILRGGILVGIPALYLFNQSIGGASITYRYAAPTIPIMIFGAYKFLDWILFKKLYRPVYVRLLYVSISLCIILPNVMLSIKHIPYLKKSNDYLSVLEKYGNYLHEYSQKSDTVACYDVGAIGYYSDRFVLDLIGLVSPETIQYHNSDLFNETAIKEYKPTYIVVPWFADMYNKLELFPRGKTLFKDSVYNYRFQIIQSGDERRFVNELRKLR